jgi:hypothetical protein
MSKFTFICEDDPMPFADAVVTKKTFEFNAEHLGSVIGEFESFLKGCGFHLDGYLEMVEPNQKIVEDEDLDEFTENLFNKPAHETKYGKLQPYNDYIRSEEDVEKWAENWREGLK